MPYRPCSYHLHVTRTSDIQQLNERDGYFRNTIRMSNGLDPDQDLLNSVSPDMGPNRLQRLSADDKSC